MKFQRNNLAHQPRRGNTIVLVTGILVLLVIIATAYITRTQAGRITATSYTAAGHRENNKQFIADNLATEIAQALFVRNVADSNFNGVIDSNDQRELVRHDAVRYSVDNGDWFVLGGYKPNFAPYHVVPYTNWPDLPLGNPNAAFWPSGLGNQTAGAGTFSVLLNGEDNPLGNPGIGDARWLRDLEPVRWDSWNIFSNSYTADGIPDAFSHWRHMTNISRSDNAYRIVFDISDVGDSNDDGFGRLVTDLNVPVEQWLATPHAYLNPNTGDTNLLAMGPNPNTAFNNFMNLWGNWLGVSPLGITGYQNALTDPFATPPNFLRLSDLNANGIKHELGERPQDEFIPGTARWYVGRVLADTDGDGYTDSFWFLAPTSSQNGIRQIVAVSIIDNGGMLNAQVATRFIRSDVGNPIGPKKTRGLGPFDLALVGNLATTDRNDVGGSHYGNWNTGFYDCPDHDYLFPFGAFAEPDAPPPGGGSNFWKFDYDASLAAGASPSFPQPWQRHMQELGFTQITAPGLNHPLLAARLDFWRRSASRMLGSEVQTGYNPFTLGDELELRMYHGSNTPWTFSRYEYATQVRDTDPNNVMRFLRANERYEESNEYVDQRPNRKLFIDKRSKLTLFNGARNETMPPAIWLFQPPYIDRDGNGVVNMLDLPDLNGNGNPIIGQPNLDAVDHDLLRFGMLKFDLRLGPFATIIGPYYDFDLDGVFDDYGFSDPPLNHTGNAFDLESARYNSLFGRALRDRLEVSLVDSQTDLLITGKRGSYFGEDDLAAAETANADKTRRLAASYAANIVQWRDQDVLSRLDEAIPVRDVTGTPPPPTQNQTYFMGMEPQPFLLEAFVGHVYKHKVVPDADFEGDVYGDPGYHIILDAVGQDTRSTVVVVQVANPYNVPIDISGYKLTVFGQDLILGDAAVRDPLTGVLSWPGGSLFLAPGTEEKPTTAIFYSIDESLIGLDPNDSKWLNFLDIDAFDHPDDTIIRAAVHPPASTTAGIRWDRDRDPYDNFVADDAIVLSRIEPTDLITDPNPRWIDVDRIDRNITEGCAGTTHQELTFLEAVREMDNTRPADAPSPLNSYDVAPGDLYGDYVDANGNEAIKIGTPSSAYTHWVQWVRATRAWGVDLNRNGTIDTSDPSRPIYRNRLDPSEKSPRYVFSTAVVVTPGGTPLVNLNTDDGLTFFKNGNRYKFAANPDAEENIIPAPLWPRPWFTRSYVNCHNITVPDQPTPNEPAPRKPTFFDMNATHKDVNNVVLFSNDMAWPAGTDQYHPLGRSFPDKGWYTQGDSIEDPVATAGGDSLARLRFPFSMIHKNGDFEQIGELLNVSLYGHEVCLAMPGGGLPIQYNGTVRTFSEALAVEVDDLYEANSTPLADDLIRIGRIRLHPTQFEDTLDNTTPTYWAGQVIGIADPANFNDPRHAIPQIPAALRLMDAFVCDDSGVNIYDVTGPTYGVPDGVIDQRDVEFQRLRNAKGFEGTATPGLVNINTAPPEVMRAIPHWYRLVHQSGRRRLPTETTDADGGSVLGNAAWLAGFAPQPLVTNSVDPSALLPRTMIAESVMHYRDRLTGDFDPGTPEPYTGYAYGPNYSANNRLEWPGAGVNQRIRAERGIASIGELLVLNKGGQAGNATPLERPTANAAVPDVVFDQQWRMDLGIAPEFTGTANFSAKPFWGDYGGSQFFQSPMVISTNRSTAYDFFNSNIATNTLVQRPKTTAGDVEEANALFAAASNMITTRSDVFTVYFRVRSFRQNPEGPNGGPVWDATNPEFIVDDSRYVMLVDRSNVNKPSDQPRILYLEKLPN